MPWDMLIKALRHSIWRVSLHSNNTCLKISFTPRVHKPHLNLDWSIFLCMLSVAPPNVMPYNSLRFSAFLDDWCKTSTMHASVYRVHTLYTYTSNSGYIRQVACQHFSHIPTQPVSSFLFETMFPEIIGNYALSKSFLHTIFTDCPWHVIYMAFLSACHKWPNIKFSPIVCFPTHLFKLSTVVHTICPENNNFLMSIYDRMDTRIAKFMGPTWDPPGSCRPQMAPCWPHEPCYQGNHPTVAKVEGAGVLDGKFCTILE